jgi:hypothetical protein
MLDAEKNQLRAVAGGARQVCALEGLGIEQIYAPISDPNEEFVLAWSWTQDIRDAEAVSHHVLLALTCGRLRA